MKRKGGVRALQIRDGKLNRPHDGPRDRSVLSSRKAADDFIKYETAEILNLIGFCCQYAFVMSSRSISSSLQRQGTGQGEKDANCGCQLCVF